jgi:hypothetical protein
MPSQCDAVADEHSLALQCRTVSEGVAGPYCCSCYNAGMIDDDKHLESSETDRPQRYQLTQERMNVITSLIWQVVKAKRGFKIYPPWEVTSDPSILRSDEIMDRLADSKWWLRLADGREELLSLPELLALTYNLLTVKHQSEQAKKRGPQKVKGKMRLTFAVHRLMTPDIAKTLLGKVILEGMHG